MIQTDEEQIRRPGCRLFRSDDHAWYIRTREGTKGPFVNQKSAEQYLHTFVRKEKSFVMR